MMRVRTQQRGFMLATVLVLSLVIVSTMVTLLVVASNSYKDGYVDHYQKLADEAAEAGAAYATACLGLSEHVQTWGAAAGKSNLTSNADCNGSNTYASNAYVYNDSAVRSYFVVGNLDYTTPFSAQISATGYSEVLGQGGVVKKTYTSIQKKVLTWPTDITGQMSASGTNRTCAIVSYTVYCWGLNAYGQLGNGMYIGSPAGLEVASAVDSSVPVKVRQDPGVMAGKKIVKIFVAQYHSCALSQDGLMYCWGYNSSAQLGTGNAVDSAVPVQVGGALAGKVVTDIGGTSNTTCAIAVGKIYCWGRNANGQAGVGSVSAAVLNPTLVSATGTATTLPVAYTATALSTSGSRSQTMCAIEGGKAYCWGLNGTTGTYDVGAIGDDTVTQRTLPTKVYDAGVLSGKTVTSISQDGYVSKATGGYAHVCVIASGGLYCWGENGSGQLGTGNQNDSKRPVAVDVSGVLSGKTIQEVQVGLYHSCVRASGGAYCWGENGSGQVGNNTNLLQTSPAVVSLQPGGLTATNVVAIGAGANRGCATVTDGRTFCWGLNSKGQIGDGTTVNRKLPTESLFLRPSGNAYLF